MEIQRKQWLDVAKGLAVLGVIVVHFPKDISWGIGWMTFHVNVFFVIAGYLIYQNGIAHFRYIEEIKKYILLFIKLSIFYIMFWGIIRYAGHIDGMFNFILLQLYKTLTFTGIGTLWFLPTFLLGKILFITLLKIFSKKFLFVVEMIITITVSCICYYLYRNGIMGTIHFEIGSGLYISGIILDLLSVILQGVIASGFVCLGYFLHFIFENILNQSFISKDKNLVLMCASWGGVLCNIKLLYIVILS